MKKSHLKFSAAATLPAGFRAAGIVAGLKKSRKPDMALFFSDVPAVLAGTFTTNQVKAATVPARRRTRRQDRLSPTASSSTAAKPTPAPASKA
jgi:glutamate N-acetyltransferase/amino-acid N-acetyltransferase